MEFITTLDFQILDWIQSAIRSAFLDPVMAVFSYIGNAGAVWIVLAIILLVFRKTRPAGVAVLAALALGFALGEGLIKHIVCRPRPFLVNTAVTLSIKAPSGYSFPSGHTTVSFASTFTLTAILKNKWVALGAYFTAALIAFSRLYNYVHYPSDVICGILLGTLCAIVVTAVFRRFKLDSRLSRPLMYKGGNSDKK